MLFSIEKAFSIKFLAVIILFWAFSVRVYAGNLGDELTCPRDVIGKIIAKAKLDANYPAIVSRIDVNGKICYKASSGLANIENQVPASFKSVFPIGSITKLFTAALIHISADQGLLNLDDRLQKYFPSIQGLARDVSIRDLLRHTSGLAGYTGTEKFRNDMGRKWSHDEVVELITTGPMMYLPGTGWQYLNGDYYLLGVILEQIYKKTYVDILKQNILIPLKLDDTYYYSSQELVPGRAAAYSINGKSIKNSILFRPEVLFSAGALGSTVDDLAKFIYGLYRDKIFGPQVASSMAEISILQDGTDVPTLLGGSFSNDLEGHRYIHHSGIAGGSALTTFYPDDNVLIVLEANTAQVKPALGDVERTIARLIFGIEKKNRLIIDLESESLNSLSGKYVSGPIILYGAIIEFIEEDGSLWVNLVPGMGEYKKRLNYHGDGLFSVLGDSDFLFDFSKTLNNGYKVDIHYGDLKTIGFKPGKSKKVAN